MRDLPATFGLPSQLDVLFDELRGPGADSTIESSTKAVRELLQYLRWLSTSPMPAEEYVVAVSLSEACEAALEVLDARSAWCLTTPESGAGAE